MAKLYARRSHNKLPDGRYFLSSAMMAEVKRDDAARNAQAKRNGVKNPKLVHIPCGCGCGVMTMLADRDLADRIFGQE